MYVLEIIKQENSKIVFCNNISLNFTNLEINDLEIKLLSVYRTPESYPIQFIQQLQNLFDSINYPVEHFIINEDINIDTLRNEEISVGY